MNGVASFLMYVIVRVLPMTEIRITIYKMILWIYKMFQKEIEKCVNMVYFCGVNYSRSSQTLM